MEVIATPRSVGLSDAYVSRVFLPQWSHTYYSIVIALMKTIANIFLKGLLVVLPLVVTFGLLYWLFSGAEEILQIPLKALLPTGWYMPGMGVLSACGIIFVCGLLVQSYLIKPLFSLMELLLDRIPIVKTLYGSARDLMKFAIGDKEAGMQKVVSVEVKDDIFLIGFVTNDSPSISNSENRVAVFFPMSYQMGGYLAYVSKDKCTPLDMPVEQAMQTILMADMVKKRK